MTIEEAQQLVEVWSAKHPCESGPEGDENWATNGNCPPTPMPNAKLNCGSGTTAAHTSAHTTPTSTGAPVALGEHFWELLDEANREGVDLTAALTETLARLNAADK